MFEFSICNHSPKIYLDIIYMSNFLYQESRQIDLSQNNEVYTMYGF